MADASNDDNAPAPAKKAPKKKQIDFIVTTSDPNGVANAANKKRVRSVAALKSWPERRKKIFEQLESSGSGQGAFLVNEPEQVKRATPAFTPVRHRPPGQYQTGSVNVTSGSLNTVSKRPRVYGPPPPTRPQASGSGKTRPDAIGSLNPQAHVFVPTTAFPTGDISTQTSNDLEKRKLPRAGSSIELYRKAFSRLKAPVEEHRITSPDVPCECPRCRSKRRIANTPPGAGPSTHVVVPARTKRMADGSEKPMEFSADMAMLTPPSSPGPYASSGNIDPFNCYPVEYQPWFDKILHHMMTVYAPRGWPALKISDDQGVKWEWFMTQNALSEPALFYVRLLFGSGDMIRLGGMRAEIMYWLRAQAIKAINSALVDPKRSCSDALILAVGRIALHEHMYGDKHASSHVHRPAQKRMIELRGGMRALEFPELVKRLMRWSDRIMAVGSGTERLLEDDDLNPNFSLKQSVGAIERWAPQEMPGVRSKIKISDLVNDEDEK